MRSYPCLCESASVCVYARVCACVIPGHATLIGNLGSYCHFMLTAPLRHTVVCMPVCCTIESLALQGHRKRHYESTCVSLRVFGGVCATYIRTLPRKTHAQYIHMHAAHSCKTHSRQHGAGRVLIVASTALEILFSHVSQLDILAPYAVIVTRLLNQG